MHVVGIYRLIWTRVNVDVSNSRFVAEVRKENQKEFERTLKGVSWGLIGCVSDESDFKVYGLDGKICIEDNIYNLKEAWQKPLRW